MAKRHDKLPIVTRSDNAIIIDAIRHGKKLDSIGLQMTATGKIDLRNTLIHAAGKINPNEPEWRQERFDIKKFHFDNIDFSGANLNEAWFIKCVFTNCLFEKTQMEQVRLEAMQIIDCQFINTRLNDSSIGMRNGNDSGLIKNTLFKKTDLRYTMYHFPEITDTVFDYCNLHEADFDGSRFTNCTFRGKLNKVWFRGYSHSWRPGFSIWWNRYKKFPNPMMNVDFTEADLDDVDFSQGIDLSHCRFMLNENQLLVKDIAAVYGKARQIIADTWTGKEREQQLTMIDQHYIGKNRQEQKMDILVHYPQFEHDKKFFDLIRQINDAH